MFLRELHARNVRNLRDERLELSPGVNVFTGANAQGKTSILETAGLVARARSFRTEQTRHAIQRGAPSLVAGGRCQASGGGPDGGSWIEVELRQDGRELRIDGRPVAAREYHGRLDVVVYSTERLRIVHGGMRARRQFVDRGAAALWPAYRALVRECERVTRQRAACLQDGAAGLDAWDERLVAVGGQLRARRATYVASLQGLIDTSFMPEQEDCAIELSHTSRDESEQREQLMSEIAARRHDERRAGRGLVGPHRDEIALRVAGEEAAEGASSGQARSLLLALVLATLELQRQERGTSAVALLDDLDSELDEQRSLRFCRRARDLGQLLITTAHPAWAERAAADGALFDVEAGRVRVRA